VYTANEQAYLSRIRQHVTDLRDLLNACDLADDMDVAAWFDFLSRMRAIQGNTSNDYSFLACILAKRWLAERFDIGDFDAAAKPQGAPGLDIDLLTRDGKRIVGEIKTTVPYSGAKHDLGAQQKASFQKDFSKLNRAEADYKFFFVTDTATFDIVRQRYAQEIPGVEIVLLTQHEA
jgi:hypothetical protein